MEKKTFVYGKLTISRTANLQEVTYQISIAPGKRLQFANLKMAQSKVDLPSYKMVIFHSQVSLPEGSYGTSTIFRYHIQIISPAKKPDVTETQGAQMPHPTDKTQLFRWDKQTYSTDNLGYNGYKLLTIRGVSRQVHIYIYTYLYIHGQTSGIIPNFSAS